MSIERVESTIVSVPYLHRELSSRVQRDGVSAVVVKITDSSGHIGWGECCPGPNIESIDETVRAAIPLLMGQDPWDTEKLAALFFETGHWDLRPMSGNFAYAGLDMALWDLCGKLCGQPLYRLFGGLRRDQVNYFCYLPTEPIDEVLQAAGEASDKGYSVFYLKVGRNVEQELDTVAQLRRNLGPAAKIRIDANGAWSVAQARRYLARFDQFDIDFAEQPVAPYPTANMAELRTLTPVPLAANEGLWRQEDVWEVMRNRSADILCFSPYWVGTLARFHRLSHAAALEGLSVCRHTHGELGLMAAASHHLCLTLPNLVEGNQQTATLLSDDILSAPLPIADSANWGIPNGPGLGVEVDAGKILRYNELYIKNGQFLPYQID
jgi:L-Ala-D/L-Glu epimerase